MHQITSTRRLAYRLSLVTIVSKESLVMQPTDRNPKALLHAAQRPAETKTDTQTETETETETDRQKERERETDSVS